MFENAGSKLKVLGYIYFAIGVLASIFLGFFNMVELGIISLLIIPFGIFFSWLSLLVIMAIAEAAIYSKLTYERVIRTRNPASINVEKQEVKVTDYKTFSNEKLENGWTCSCGHKNKMNDQFCINCGKYK